ncbi:hypothetical protein AN161_26780 [Lysinibacillus sp. FJAT-14222]|nr:hypothetical protein AN161_26780 [Lysinibacillus sp. FJAT-14222]
MKLLNSNFFMFILAFVIAIPSVNLSVTTDFKNLIYLSIYLLILTSAGFLTIKYLFKIFNLAVLKFSKN